MLNTAPWAGATGTSQGYRLFADLHAARGGNSRLSLYRKLWHAGTCPRHLQVLQGVLSAAGCSSPVEG